MLLVPHSGQDAHRWRIPFPLLWLAAAVAAVSALALAWLGCDYLRLRSAARELGELRAVNAQQAKEIEALAARAADVEERLNALNALDAQVREMLGLPPPQKAAGEEAVSLRSRGGPARSVSLRAVAASLADSAAALDPTAARLSELKEKVDQHQRRLAHRPAAWPVSGRITSRFGLRRSPFGRGTEYHEGIDIAAPYGAPVRATADGRVTFAGWRAGYGRLVIIDHGYGYQTVYGHNSQITVHVGQSVKRGDVIAHVGSSGRSSGPHVHYEVVYQGKKRNPLDYLP